MTLVAHLHAIILRDSFNENFLHSIALSLQFVHNLNVRDNIILLNNPDSPSYN